MSAAILLIFSNIAEFLVKVAVDFVAICVDIARFGGGHHTASGFMPVTAVVELAVADMRFQIGHVGGQLSRVNMIQPKFLKTW